MIGWGERREDRSMGRLIGFKNKKEGSAEGEIYPPEVEELEKKIEQEMEALKQKVLEHGIDSITEEDAKKFDLLTFKTSILYEIYDMELEEGG
jgi:hypothetical protein